MTNPEASGDLPTLGTRGQLLTEVEDPRKAARATQAKSRALDHLGEPVEAMRQSTVAAEVLHKLNATRNETKPSGASAVTG